MTQQRQTKRDRLLSLFRQRGFVFIHVPKTGGFSITQALMQGIATEHATAAELQGELGRSTWQQLFTFGFVRNPSTRFISAFWFLKAGGMNRNDSYWAKHALGGVPDAQTFIRLLAADASLRQWVHFRPQCHFLCDTTGAIAVDFVGCFESLSEDFCHIANRIGVPNVRLSKFNVTPSVPELFTQWAPESQRMLFEVYQEDYSIFGYQRLH